MPDLDCILLNADKWKWVLRDGYPLLKVQCPRCDCWGDVIDHTIADSGTIDPSVMCGEGCGWHAMVMLKQFHRIIRQEPPNA